MRTSDLRAVLNEIEKDTGIPRAFVLQWKSSWPADMDGVRRAANHKLNILGKHFYLGEDAPGARRREFLALAQDYGAALLVLDFDDTWGDALSRYAIDLVQELFQTDGMKVFAIGIKRLLPTESAPLVFSTQGFPERAIGFSAHPFILSYYQRRWQYDSVDFQETIQRMTRTPELCHSYRARKILTRVLSEAERYAVGLSAH